VVISNDKSTLRTCCSTLPWSRTWSANLANCPFRLRQSRGSDPDATRIHLGGVGLATLRTGLRQLNRKSPLIMLRRKSGSTPPVGVVRET
jgi:hypothetical protein